MAKSSNTKGQGLLTLPYQTERPWADISVDLITCLPDTTGGHDSILTVVDRATKMVILVPTTIEITAEKFAQLMTEHVISKQGVPLNILSDRDPRFTGHFWKAVTHIWGIHPSVTSSYHPESDGQTERANRTIEQVLRAHAMESQKEWDKTLCMVEFAMNNSVHASLKYSPFYLNTGRNPLTPIMGEFIKAKSVKCSNAYQFTTDRKATLDLAMENIKVARDRYKSYADAGRKDTQFKEGEQVMLSTVNINKHTLNRKLFPKFLGPFRITQVVNDVAYKLDLPNRWEIHDVFHVSLLKPWVAGKMGSPPPIPDQVEGELEYIVERILDHRILKTSTRKNKNENATSTARTHNEKKEFYVKWEGYGMEHCTWEPEAMLDNSQDAIAEYFEQKAQVQVRQTKKRKAMASTSKEA